MNKDISIALTGFMGVGKSSVARHVANRLKAKRIDLDYFIEKNESRSIAEIIDSDGLEAYRKMETANLEQLLGERDWKVLSLGGGTWTIPQNREMLKLSGYTSVWLESTFEHCWLNIVNSRKDRPLARDKKKAKALFEERQTVYCLADWHFIIRPGYTSYDLAKQIVEEIFC